MRLRPGLCPGPRWGGLQRSPSAANLFTVYIALRQRVRGVIARMRYKNIDLLTYLHQ